MQFYIFDVDGTLLDTRNMYLEPLRSVLDKHGYNVSDSLLNSLFGITTEDALEILKVKEKDIIKKEWFEGVLNYSKSVNIFSGIQELLSTLQSKNKKLAVATSKVKEEFQRDFTPFNLNQYFDQFVFANEVKKGKPAPDMILKGIEKLGADPKQTIYVGDTIYDLEASHSAGVHFGLAGWGGFSSKLRDKLNVGDFWLASPPDLLKQ